MSLRGLAQHNTAQGSTAQSGDNTSATVSLTPAGLNARAASTVPASGRSLGPLGGSGGPLVPRGVGSWA